MAGSPPVVTENSLSQTVADPGTTVTWTTRALDATARTVTMKRLASDSQGNTVEVTESLTIGEVISWGTPTCDDPAISFLVDAQDPTIVYVAVSPDA